MEWLTFPFCTTVVFPGRVKRLNQHLDHHRTQKNPPLFLRGVEAGFIASFTECWVKFHWLWSARKLRTTKKSPYLISVKRPISSSPCESSVGFCCSKRVLPRVMVGCLCLYVHTKDDFIRCRLLSSGDASDRTHHIPYYNAQADNIVTM